MDLPAKVREDVGRPGKGDGRVIVRSADSQSSLSEAPPGAAVPWMSYLRSWIGRT